MQNRLDEVLQQLDFLHADEEIMWAERAKCNWIQFGDKNSKYFHQKVPTMRNKNKIHRIRDHNDIWYEDGVDLAKLFIGDYAQRFKSEHTNRADTIDTISARITTEDNDNLVWMVTREEIDRAICSIGASKAPGPNGIFACFYHKYWEYISDTIYNMVHDFFNNNLNLVEINYAYITLIPKQDNPVMVNHY